MGSIKTVLVTTDFSETSVKAVAPAEMLARKFGARIIAAHVSEPFTPFIEGGFAVTDLEAINQEAHARAAQQLEKFGALFDRELKVELASAIGVPDVEIVKLADERGADLIVMAMHGRGFVSHALLGSTTERVLRHAKCPVLVMPEPKGR